MRSPLLVAAALGLCGAVFFALRNASAPEDRFVASEPAAVAPGETLIPTDISFTPLEQDGVMGGRATTTLPGTPAEIYTAITDTEHAAAHRSFARKMEVLSRERENLELALTLKGKLGISPTIHVLYQTTRTEGDITITYALTRKAFGIARYFGSYRIQPLPGSPARSRFTSTIFISSGVSLASVDHEEIEAGQRADQIELRAWMRERLAQAR